ncbi:hypothetical protein EC957_006655 [Mortierella hygrophila]|uniref:Pheromone-regulated membrane protein 10 n=1 Tax=Mortierella hygrophila TaxID=979708 RepID=A0A9P6FE47_9FUNG|nr:hypothetical protein EC957_006655 [Mortierella hygrophila]
MHAGGASSGFALPSASSKRFPGPLEPINPFNPAGSSSSTPEDTPLGTPTAELQKLSLGVERFARAIEDPGLVGSFSGTVPLPTLSQVHAAAKRRPSKILMEDLSSHPHHHHGHNDANGASSSSATVVGATPTDLSNNNISLGSLKRAITGRVHHQDAVVLDLESNMGQLAQGNISDNEYDAKMDQDAPGGEKYPDEKHARFDTVDLDNIDPSEGFRRRKPKGGILSQLLKLQRSEAAAVTAASTSGSPPPSRTSSTTNKNSSTLKKTKKGFYYRATSRNNSTTSLKDSAPPSVTTTPRVSPRNSTVFERDPQQQQRKRKSGRSVKGAATDHRSIHRDIAEILTRQSFLIMMAKSLVLYGAPAHRIEETCALLARKMDVDASFALLPGLMTISFSDPETHTSDTRHLRCSQGMDMNKLAQVHKIALAVLRGESVEDANRDLERVTLEPPIYPLWLTLLGWLGSSAFVTPLAFGGGWYDMALAGFCGLMVGVLGVVASRFPVYGNVFEITASILVGFLAKSFGDRVCFEAVALAGVVVLLPGLLLTQAIMELSSRNIVSGAVRMFYALMYAFFLGFGLTIGAELWSYVSGQTVLASPDACKHSINRWWYFLIYPAVSASINIVFNAHLRQWFGMTLVTSVGFVLTLFLKSGPQITAAIAAFAVGVTGQLYGRVTGQLSYVPLLSGVLLLVPGSVGVRGILAIIGSDPSQGFTFVLTMINVSVAITLGVFLSALVVYPFWRKSTFMNF